MSKSDYLEERLLNLQFGLASPHTTPATVYIALYTAAPSDTGGGTEVSGNAYARVAVTNTGANWTRVASSISNATAITFPSPTPSAWGTITHFGILDAASAGNLLRWAALTNARATAVGVAVSFAIGALTATED